MAENPRPLNDLPIDRARPGDYIIGLQGDNAKRFQWPFINGDAMALDGDGNPTPDTSVYNPSDYPEGTVFRALNYPAAVDGGSMEFTLISGAWVWTHGTYRASNNNGSYQRSADGGQQCGWTSGILVTENQVGSFYRTTNAVRWDYPVPFASPPRVSPAVEYANINEPFGSRVSSPAASYTFFHLYGTRATSDGRVSLQAFGRWK